MKLEIPLQEQEFSFIHGVISVDCEVLNKWKKEISIDTYPLQTTGTIDFF